MNCAHLGFYLYLMLPFLAMVGARLGPWVMKMGSPGNRAIDVLLEEARKASEEGVRRETPYRTPDVLDLPPKVESSSASLAPFVPYHETATPVYRSRPCPKCGETGVPHRYAQVPYLDFQYRPAVTLGPWCTGRRPGFWAWCLRLVGRSTRCTETREHFHCHCAACKAVWLMAPRDAG